MADEEMFKAEGKKVLTVSYWEIGRAKIGAVKTADGKTYNISGQSTRSLLNSAGQAIEPSVPRTKASKKSKT